MFLAATWLLLSYLLGAFPTGVVLATLYADTDITARGSGNIGATNMYRILGRGFGLLTLGVDLLKGLVPVLVATTLLPSPLYAGLVGLAAFAGHCWSPFLDMRGGKGVATGAGVMLALAPGPALLAGLTWMLVVGATRRSSLGALVAVAVLPLLCLVLAPGATWEALALGLGITWRHRDNLARLRAGTELSARSGDR
ncbi:MAG: glycerol-3-phosphate 1-O-acyltransferase [Deltaproteobacteria bacterium]|nr:MAG: glycerol-3-phosphate 1-O-acyltransferase [Deltaproteobacteria bacterium]